MKTTDLTKEFKKLEAQSAKLALNISGRIINLHGQYASRSQELSSVVYSHSDVASSEKDKVDKSAQLTRLKTVQVHTFPRNGGSQLIAPVGGNRGYLKGALRASLSPKYGADLAKRGSPVYGLKKRVEQGLFIEPDWLELGDSYSNPQDEPARFFLTNVGIYEFYDYIKELPFNIQLRVESVIPKEVILELLVFIQRIGIGPKRRGLIKIDKVEEITGI